MNRAILVIILFVSALLSSCVEPIHPFTKLPPGEWRGVLKLGPPKVRVEEVTKETVRALRLSDIEEEELPFNFEVIYDNDTTFHIVLKNGAERIVVNDIQMGWKNSIGKDTIVINFPVYETYLEGVFAEDMIEGYYVVPSKGNYRIPFVAKFGRNYRFSTQIKEPKEDFSGKWAVTFGVDTEEPYPAIGEFTQTGKKITGTFMTETGDFRFLEGEVVNDKMYLSCFDGSHAFLFEGKKAEDGKISGLFRSGKHYKTLWTAYKDENARLSNPDQLTFLKEGYDRIEFAFEDLDGNVVTADDDRFKNKIKVFQIMGTWCPNCRDETLFLNKYLLEHPSDEIAVVGLAFERQKSKEKAFEVLKKFKEKLSVQYDVLLGSIDKNDAEKKLPMLNHIMSFPTMIIVDKNDAVVKIHTGFSGPATSEYETFVQDFTNTIDSLLQK